MDSNDYVWTCKELYLKGIHPFDFDKINTSDYIRLKEIAQKIINKKGLQYFLGFLMEYQYRVNLWTAYFGLEIGNPDKNEILEISKDITIIDSCIEDVERNLDDKTTENQKENGLNWIEKIKNAL